MTAADIRSLYVETIARAFYEAEADDEKATTGVVWPSWDRLVQSDAHRAIQDARLAVDALAEAGLLPIYVDYRWVYEPDGTPLGYRERQLLTDWQEATLAPSVAASRDASAHIIPRA